MSFPYKGRVHLNYYGSRIREAVTKSVRAWLKEKLPLAATKLIKTWTANFVMDPPYLPPSFSLSFSPTKEEEMSQYWSEHLVTHNWHPYTHINTHTCILCAA